MAQYPHLDHTGAIAACICRLIMSRNLVLLSSVSQGEICLCTSRIYVERSIYPEFLERFVAAAKQWRTGDPSDGSNNNGALISKEHLEKVAYGSRC